MLRKAAAVPLFFSAYGGGGSHPPWEQTLDINLESQKRGYQNMPGDPIVAYMPTWSEIFLQKFKNIRKFSNPVKKGRPKKKALRIIAELQKRTFVFSPSGTVLQQSPR